MAEIKKRPVVRKSPIKKSTKGVAKRTPATATSKKVAIKKKKLRLTSFELRLLEHPPNTGTWRCTCEIINNSSMTRCWICGSPKSSGEEVYPLYEKLCEKVGITPGIYWRITDRMRDIVMCRAPKEKWKQINLPEGYTL